MATDVKQLFKSRSYKIVLWLTIIGLVVALGLPPMMRQATGDTWVIQVNGEEISEKKFRRKVVQQQEFLANLRQQYGVYADFLLQSIGMRPDPRELAFQILVQEELLNQVANKIGVHVHEDHMADKLGDFRFVQQELSDLISPQVFDQTGNINVKALSGYLRRMGLSMSDFEALVKEALKRALVRSLVIGSSYIPSYAITQRYIADYLSKKFSILKFSFDQYLKQARQNPVTHEELTKFYNEQNKQYKRYWVPEKRGGLVWAFKPSSYDISVEDSEIRGYYDDYKAKRFVKEPTTVQVRRILLKVPNQAQEEMVKSRAEQIRKEVTEDPTSFAEKAKKVSEDKTSASKGGLIEKFARGEKERSFERAAFLLKNDGDISEVVRTQDGYEIVQRVHKNMTSYIPFNEVKKEIKQELIERKFKKEFLNDVKQALQSNTLDRIITAKGAKPDQIAPLIQDESQQAKALFKMKKGESSFYMDEGTGYIIKLTDIQSRHLPELDAIKDTVREDLYEQRAAQNMKSDIEQAKDLARSMPLADIKTKFNASLIKTDWLKKEQDSKELETMKNEGIPIEKMLQLEKIGSVLTQITDKNGYLIYLDEIESFDQAQISEQEADIKQALEREQINLITEAFVASLYRNATINVNESALNLYRE